MNTNHYDVHTTTKINTIFIRLNTIFIRLNTTVIRPSYDYKNKHDLHTTEHDLHTIEHDLHTTFIRLNTNFQLGLNRVTNFCIAKICNTIYAELRRPYDRARPTTT